MFTHCFHTLIHMHNFLSLGSGPKYILRTKLFKTSLIITNKENLSKLINLGKLQFPHLLKKIIQHLAQLGALWHPGGVGWVRGGSTWWARYTYTYGWFVLWYSRNQHNIVKQLSSSYGTYLILLPTIILQIHTLQNANLKIWCKILLYSLLGYGILKQIVRLSLKCPLLTWRFTQVCKKLPCQKSSMLKKG